MAAYTTPQLSASGQGRGNGLDAVESRKQAMNAVEMLRPQTRLHHCTGATSPASRASTGWASHAWLLCVGLAAAAWSVPFIHVIWWMADEGILLHAAQRMRRGERLYRDFFEYLPPGGFVLVEAWLRLFGMSFMAARGLLLGAIVGTAGFTFLACRTASNSAPLSAGLTIAV